MSQPSAFAEAFRETVVPRMEPLLRIHGHMVGLRTMDFEEAAAVCMGVANRAGLSRLDARLFDDFHDWVLTRIADSAAAVPPRVRWEHEARERRAADIVAWDRKVRAHFSTEQADGA